MCENKEITENEVKYLIGVVFMTGIVCEGGGMRGVFTAGVLQAFMDEKFLSDLLVGVSAGASNGASYVSAQAGRGKRTNINYVEDKRYISIQNLIKEKSLFGMDFIFGEIPEKLDPFDYQTFYNSECDYYAGATNLETGKVDFFGKEKILPGLKVLRASCSIPMLSNIVEIDGNKYLDGGVAEPIPLDFAIKKGCKKTIVILTRDRSYRKKPMGFKPVYSAIYKQYPSFIKTLNLRHLKYNHTLDKIAYLEKEGSVIVVAPETPLNVDRFGKDKIQLSQAYDEGYKMGLNTLKLI